MVSPNVPLPEGTASGRELWHWCQGARSLGHEVEVWVWDAGTYKPTSPLPSWCRYEPYESASGPMWREHLRSLFRPRSGLARSGWVPGEGAVAVADHPISYPAVAACERSVVIFHYLARLDARAVGRYRLSLLQDFRAERRATRSAGLTLAMSGRVARYLHRSSVVVPAAFAVPPQPIALTEEPVAALMADWLWPPNQIAAQALLKAWPAVRDEVPSARLLLAGRRLDVLGVGPLPGVTLLGPVKESIEVLSQASVLAFPCPSSSGPKVKVLEALALGLPVVTTAAGVEGLMIEKGEGAIVSDAKGFPRALGRLLASPDERAKLAAAGRSAIADHHSPAASAGARLSAIRAALGDK